MSDNIIEVDEDAENNEIMEVPDVSGGDTINLQNQNLEKDEHVENTNDEVNNENLQIVNNNNRNNSEYTNPNNFTINNENNYPDFQDDSENQPDNINIESTTIDDNIDNGNLNSISDEPSKRQTIIRFKTSDEVLDQVSNNEKIDTETNVKKFVDEIIAKAIDITKLFNFNLREDSIVSNIVKRVVQNFVNDLLKNAVDEIKSRQILKDKSGMKSNEIFFDIPTTKIKEYTSGEIYKQLQTIEDESRKKELYGDNIILIQNLTEHLITEVISTAMERTTQGFVEQFINELIQESCKEVGKIQEEMEQENFREEIMLFINNIINETIGKVKLIKMAESEDVVSLKTSVHELHEICVDEHSALFYQKSTHTEGAMSDVSSTVLSDEQFQEEGGEIQVEAQQDELAVLDPDNPLMIRFQATLKTHLIKQKERIHEEIQQLKGEIKDKSDAEELLSQQIYNNESRVNQQQQSLTALLNKTQEITSKQDELTAIITQQKSDLEEKSEEFFNSKKKDEELMLEIESLAALIKQFSEWEQTQAGDVTMTKIMTDHQKDEKKRLHQERIKMDLLILAINAEISKINTKFKSLEEDISFRIEELQNVEQAVADGEADIITLRHETKKLHSVWEHVTLNIQERDEILNQLKNQQLETEGRFKTLECEIDNFKSEGNNEIKNNEKLLTKFKILEKSILNEEKNIKKEKEKSESIKTEMSRVMQMQEFTDQDLKKSMQVLNHIAKTNNKTLENYDEIKESIYNLELQLVQILKVEATESKYCNKIQNQTNTLRAQIRKKEVLMADLENKLARAMLETEKERTMLLCGKASLKEAEDRVEKKEKELKDIINELERTKVNSVLVQDQVNKHMKILENIKERTGESELSPEEIKIRDLERNISNLDDKVQELQQIWLRQGNHLLTLSQQRLQQLHQINVMSKQVIILDKKNLKIDNDLKNQENEEKKYINVKATIQSKLVKLNELCFQKKGYKETLTNNNLCKKSEYVGDLKDEQDATLSLANEIEDLEENKMELYNRISEMQKELLAWEKKLQMAVETRQLLEKLHGEGGELANMKNEIHRMEVRYSQLRKAQEKLTQDLDMCITRRDSIVDVAHAREKKSAKGVHYTRQQFIKKVEDLKGKLLQTINETKTKEGECIESNHKKNELSAQFDVKNEHLHGLEIATEQMDLQLAEGHLHRQKNLEVLVRLQRKSRLYSELKGSRYKLLFRNESALDMESQKQKTLNSDLISIIEALVNDFPSLQLPFNSVLNGLKINSSVILSQGGK